MTERAPTLPIVALLRQILERAERGEISGIAIATTSPDLCTASAWSMEEATLAELLGSVVIMQARLVQQAQEVGRDARVVGLDLDPPAARGEVVPQRGAQRSRELYDP